ncbi:immunoglobulin superfamily DCC subclass member 3-like, partial [Lithobates pipiens]
PALSGDLSFLTEPADAVAVRNQPLTLHCLAEGEPPVNITWYKDGEPLPGSAHIQQLRNGSLWIAHFQKRQRNASGAGEYSCSAQNRYGRLLSRKAKVQLAFLSHFHLNPQPMRVTEGGVARFHCLTTSVPKATITWERNRTVLTTSDPRYTVLPDGILQISGVTRDDVGTYRCLARNPANSRHSKEAWLTLADSTNPSNQEPVILSGPQNLTLTIHQTAILECVATGNPRPIVSWSRLDGRSIGVEGIQVLGNGNLMISDVSVKHSGVYVCAANRPGTRVRRTAQGMLLVQAPPEFVQWPQSVSHAPGDNTTFSCEARGSPEPALVWLKNGKYLSPQKNARLSADNRTLTIFRVTSADEALYQCIAENSAGTSQASARLAVTLPLDSPKAPEKVMVVPISTTSVRVTWAEPPPEVMDGIIGYVLHVCKDGDPSTQEMQEALSKTTFQHTVNNLEPSTDYVLFLRAYSPLGTSRDSRSIVVTTPGRVPRTPDFSVTVVNESAVQVGWGAAADGNAIRGYRLEYRRIPSTTFQGTRTLPGNQTSFIFYGLELSSLYEIRLVAFSSGGDGNSTQRFVSLKPNWNMAPDPAPACLCEEGETMSGLVLGIHIGGACIVLCLLLLFVVHWKSLLCKTKANWATSHVVENKQNQNVMVEDGTSAEVVELLSENPMTKPEAALPLRRVVDVVCHKDQSHEPSQGFQKDQSHEPSQGLQKDESHKPSQGLQKDESHKPSQGLQKDQSHKPSQGPQKEGHKPSQGLQKDQSHKPSQGLQKGESHKPSQGLQKDQSHKPSQGLQKDQSHKPSQGLQKGQSHKPSQGLQKDQSHKPSQGLQKDQSHKPSQGLQKAQSHKPS